MGNLIGIATIGLLFWLWLDGARARETAEGIARTLCERENLQFLDETVSLCRLAPRGTPNGIRLRRMYSFDYSVEGVGRHKGYIILIGSELEQTDIGNMGRPEKDITPKKAQSNVIDITQRHKDKD